MVAAQVNLWNHNVGVVIWQEDSKKAYFEFEKEFLNSSLDISPLTMALDTARQASPIFTFPLLPVETFKSLPGLLADSLPDKYGTSLINEWLIAQGRDIDSFSPVERLCYIGKRGMGAIEYEPEMDKNSNNTSKIELSDMVHLTNDVLQKRLSLNANVNKNSKEAILKIIHVGSSAGGARPKAVIAYNDKTGEILSGQTDAPDGFSQCLIKLDGVFNQAIEEPKGYGRIEFAYYKMALDCGINMTHSKLIEDNDRAHFITKRFDRLPGNEKVHMQTLCGIAHLDFNNPNKYSYEQAFQVMRVLRLPYPDAQQLYTRMVFNDMAKNYDDHTKNISFLMDKTGAWSLSPAYDVTFAYNPSNMWIQRHQLSINGKREEITEKDYLAVAKEMNIKNSKEIISNVRETVSNWKKYAKESGVSEKQTLAINQLINKKNSN